MSRPISDLFRHPGSLYVYCSDERVRRTFAAQLLEQGFAFGDGVAPGRRRIDRLMCVRRDFTVCFCGFVCRMQCGSLEDPVYAKEDGFDGCTRVDYARFLAGEEAYVIRGRRPTAETGAVIGYW